MRRGAPGGRSWGRRLFDINFSDLLAALALVFVLEGLLPFLNPERYRKMLMLAARMDRQTLRFMGLTSMTVGVLLLYIFK